MPFDLACAFQSRHLEDRVKASLYKNLHQAASRSRMVAVLSLFVGVASALISLATRIALLVEALIKGLTNLFGAICFKKFSWKQGLKILSLVPQHLVMLPVTMLAAGLGCLTKTLYVALSPEKSTLEYWHAHDIKAEFTYTKAQAEQGQPEAMTAVGTHLALGKGTAQNDAEAALWLKKAAQAGQPLAMAYLGGMYASGRGLERDDAEAALWLRLAFEKGQSVQQLKTEARAKNPLALFALAMAYKQGWGVPVDRPAATYWLKKAVALKIPRVQEELALLV